MGSFIKRGERTKRGITVYVYSTFKVGLKDLSLVIDLFSFKKLQLIRKKIFLKRLQRKDMNKVVSMSIFTNEHPIKM